MIKSFITKTRWLVTIILLTSLSVGQMRGASTVTYTVTGKTTVSTSGTAPTSSSASYSQTYNTAKQLTKDYPNATLTLNGYAGKKITGVVLRMKNSNSKTAAISVNVGTTSIGSVSALSLSSSYAYKTITITSTVVPITQSVTISIKASGSSVYIESFAITWEDGPSYTVNFSTGTGNPSVAARSGATFALPSTSDLTPTCSSDGWSLYSWATAAYSESTSAPTTTHVGFEGAPYVPTSATTLHAVYKKTEDDALTIGTVLWAENFGHFANNNPPSTAGTGSGTTIYDGASISYTQGTTSTKAQTGTMYAGGDDSPELLLASNNSWTISGIKTGNASDGYETNMTLTFKSNHADYLSISSSTSGVTCTVDPIDNTIWHITNTLNATTLNLTFSNTQSSNMRLDDVSLVTAGISTYSSTPSCGAGCDEPTALTKGSINASSQTVCWTDAANAAGGYLVAYSTIETTAPASSVKSTGTSGNYTVVAIASGTKTADIPCNAAGTYNWWVRSKCSTDSYSDWVDGSSWTMKTIYLNTNYDWNAGGAKFAVHYWNDDPTPKSGWSKLMTEQTDCLGGIYKVLVPDGYNNINFGRFSTAQVTDPTDWTNRWNQTADLTIPSSPAKDYFTLSSKTGDYDYNGSWSNYTQSFQISFNLNKGGASFSTYPASAPDSRCVATGSTTAAPTDPVALGKVINGWYKESGCSNQWVFASQTVSANQELFANWEDVATKTIYLDASASLSGGNRWDQDGATDLVMFAHAYINNTGNPGLYYDVKMTAVSTCQPHVYSCAIPGNATHVSFARCASGTTELPATWTNPPVYNQIAGKTVESGKNLYTITDWGAATLESSPFAPTSYTMSYAAGTTPNKGGAAITGSKSSESKACDVTYTLPSSAVFSVTGYRQTAWTTSDGKTQTHAFSGSYTTNADQAFYPVWAANTYQVAFNANGGSGSAMSNQSFTYDEAAKPLTSNTYTAPGEHKYFAGWATSSSRASAGTVDYTDGQSVSNLSSTHNATVTLYAVWKDHTFTNYRTLCSALFDIVLDDGLVATTNNGSAKVADNGTTLTSIVAPTKNGYDIEGYYTTSGLATKIATNEGALQPSVSTWTDGDSKWVLGTGATFYTKWTAHEYTITYEGLEGASNTNPTSYTIETATINLANPGSRTGYTFTGWTCGGDPITSITIGSTGDKTITATWSINTPNLAVSAADHVVITATPASESAIAEGANRNVNYNKTVTLNCTPDEHWNLVWDVYKTGESSTKVALSGSGDGATFTMPDYGVTVSAVMTEATYHTATFKNNGAVIDGYDEVKTYDGERPSAPTLTDITDACDKTDCNKFYGWIAEANIWPQTIPSVAGKTIYRNAGDIPVVSGADVVYHAVWAKGTGSPDIPNTLIVKWDKPAWGTSGIAGTKADGTASTATLTASANSSTSNNYGYGMSDMGTSDLVITISGLSFIGYSSGSISFYAKSSQGRTITVEQSSGGDYSTVTTASTSKDGVHVIGGISNTTTSIRITYPTAATHGSYYLGTIRVFGVNTGTSYTFTKLTSENTAGWTTTNWDGYYIITYGTAASSPALNGAGIDGDHSTTVTVASETTITITDPSIAFKIAYEGTNQYSIQGVGCRDYINTSGKPVMMSYSKVNYDAIAYNTLTATSGNYLKYNTGSTRFGIYSGEQAPTLYKILETYTEFRITCCDKNITIGTPAKTGSGTVTFASGGEAVAVGGTVETCAGATTITATVTPTNGYQCTVLSFTRSDSEDLTPDPAISVPFTGAHSYDLPFEQNANTTLNTTVTFVALQDHYIDNMHYNATQNKSGNYGTAPTLTDETKGEQCTGLHYKFIGWIPESDMNMTTGVPTTTANMVVGGATGKYATGTNYYAIWAEEE